MLLLVFTEFGRRVHDNGSGTDHGAGGLMLGYLEPDDPAVPGELAAEAGVVRQDGPADLRPAQFRHLGCQGAGPRLGTIQQERSCRGALLLGGRFCKRSGA